MSNQQKGKPQKKRTNFGEYLSEKYLEQDKYGHKFEMNMNGKTEITTYWGATISLFAFIFLMCYTYVRFDTL